MSQSSKTMESFVSAKQFVQYLSPAKLFWQFTVRFHKHKDAWGDPRVSLHETDNHLCCQLRPAGSLYASISAFSAERTQGSWKYVSQFESNTHTKVSKIASAFTCRNTIHLRFCREYGSSVDTTKPLPYHHKITQISSTHIRHPSRSYFYFFVLLLNLWPTIDKIPNAMT
jgi:hypothetical protein